MEGPSIESLKYPIGKFQWPTQFSQVDIENWINAIEVFPKNLRKTLTSLPETLEQQPYRPGGWTVQQLVHHVADSHLNSYIRFKWALTEENPTIKAYNQVQWAQTPEIASAPISVSVAFLEALHHKWSYLLTGMKEEQWHRTFVHPETQKVFSLGATAALYAWHGKHHIAHIQGLIDRQTT